MPEPKSKAKRQTYVVNMPFPWHKGHWTMKDQELELLPQEAKALLSNGRISLKTTTTKATAVKATAESK